MTRRTCELAVALALLAGCGSDTGPTEPAATPEPSRCEPAPPKLVKYIASDLTVTGGGKLRNAQQVRSEDFSRIYFVSAEVQGAGLEGSGDVATWATNGKVLVYSVDGFAKQFSGWLDGGDTDAEFSLADDGAEESRDCVSP